MKIRAIELIRAGWGVVLLAAPNEVLDHIHGVQVDRKALVVTRILGARHLTQALVSGVNPGPEVLAAGVWVDTVHSATALGLAVVDRRRARGGVTDAVVAASWAALGWRHLRKGEARTGDARGRDRLARTVVGALPGGGRLMAQAERLRKNP
ncbi:hypothetical protein [Mycobacterium colombiense]|uniref:hypothetical protein n=1 Tax=Mycobacterium colombiense TaxID=339268 RepID=UPI00096C3568|nr:hypothetical protein [Mycobacterium colombiense]OMB95726.1 hypothetical protein A5732_10805 [Mycobacterium colombiense]OMC20406.1 hypothetical protein A5737_01075 [Mycobacterium colombiense]